MTTTDSEAQILRKYYMENEFFLSAEGILKVLSVLVCIASAALLLRGGGGCAAPALGASGAGVALGCGGGVALLAAGVLCDVPLLQPTAWLYTDIVASTAMGALLLVTAVLSVMFCQSASLVARLHGPLAIASAGMVMTSAGLTYAAVMRRWDAARGPPREPRRRPPAELDV